jgi:hypothetical protein
MYITAVAVPYGQVASDEVEEIGVRHRGPRRDEVSHWGATVHDGMRMPPADQERVFGSDDRETLNARSHLANA